MMIVYSTTAIRSSNVQDYTRDRREREGREIDGRRESEKCGAEKQANEIQRKVTSTKEEESPFSFASATLSK
jgi:hypothetical protein